MLGHFVFMVYVCGLLKATSTTQYGTENGTLKLTSVPSLLTMGDVFTLSCTSSRNISIIVWFKDDNIFFNTTRHMTAADLQTVPGVDYVNCNGFQHNVTINITSHYNGSVWKCSDARLISNNLTINVTAPEDIVSPDFVTSRSYSTTTLTKWMKRSQHDSQATTMSHTASSNTSAGKRHVGEDNTTFSLRADHTTDIPGVKRGKMVTKSIHLPELPAAQTDAYTIAGSVIGVAIAIAIVVIVIVVCVRRQRGDVIKDNRDYPLSLECQPGSSKGTARPQRESSRMEGDKLVMVDNYLYAMSSEVATCAANSMNSEDMVEREIMRDNVVYEGYPEP